LNQTVFCRAPDASKCENIPVNQLPRCEKDGCGGLLRPGVVWFGENLDPQVLMKAGTHKEKKSYR
jgi:NAD-dependent SIR2 family protein deacetylase